MWFDNWEHDLVELGFAVCDTTTGKIHIPEDQLELIGNFDETCLNLDGSSTNRGGRPEAFIYNPRFPVVRKATCKNSLTSTLVTGSTAAGEAFPPHIQYVTKAKNPETMRLDVDIAEHVPRGVLGSLGAKRNAHGQYHLDRMRRVGWTKKSLLLSISSTQLCHSFHMQRTSLVTVFS